MKVDDLIFGPESDIASFVIQNIEAAQSDIKLMVFWFTWVPIADSLIAAHRRGVKVKMVLDSRSAERKNKDVDEKNEAIIPKYLSAAGFDEDQILIYDGELLHHKIILIDEDIVLTGTCNFFNASLNRHEEHYMKIQSEELHEKFNERFAYLEGQSTKWRNK